MTDGQTDRRTEGWTDRQNYDSQDRASIAASRGKNCSPRERSWQHIYRLIQDWRDLAHAHVIFSTCHTLFCGIIQFILIVEPYKLLSE